MIQRLKDCWLILTGKGTIRVYDDDPWVPDYSENASFVPGGRHYGGMSSMSVCYKLHLTGSCDCQNTECPYFYLCDRSIEEIAASLVD